MSSSGHVGAIHEMSVSWWSGPGSPADAGAPMRCQERGSLHDGVSWGSCGSVSSPHGVCEMRVSSVCAVLSSELVLVQRLPLNLIE